MALSYHTQRTIDDLNTRFAKATKGIRDNTCGSQLHKWQVDFAYMIDDIMRGPGYITPKVADNTSHFIDGIVKIRREAAEVTQAA